MSEQEDPVRWIEAADRAPPGAAELVRSIDAPPPLPPDLSAIVIRRARPRPWRRWVGPSLAAAVIVGGIVLWRFAPRGEEPVVLAPADEPTTAPASAPIVTPPPSAEAPAEPAVEEAIPTRVAMGSLTVRSSPWARVFVDGRDTGQYTPVVSLPLSAGAHALELRTSAGTSYRTTVEIRASETTMLAHRFDVPAPARPASHRPAGRDRLAWFEDRAPSPRPTPHGEHADHGYLMIQTMPWARVFVDGHDTGRNTPFRGRAPSGRYTIGLRTHDGTMHTVRIHVRPGETTRIVRQLGPPSMPVRIDEDE